MDSVARLPFERSHDAVALVVRSVGKRFLAGQDVNAVDILVIPVLRMVDVARGIEVGKANQPAERSILILADVACTCAPALVRHFGIATPTLIPFTANV